MKKFEIKPKFYIVFTIIAFVPAFLLSSFFKKLILLSGIIKANGFISQSGLVEAPSTIAIIAFIFWLYEKALWHRWPFKYINKIPNISGRYEGKGTSNFDKKQYTIAIEIKQSLLSIKIMLYTERSSSFSVLADIVKNDNGNWAVAYSYKNTPRTIKEDLDMRQHDGFAILEVFENGNKLEGLYYNNPRERGRFGSLSCRRIGKKILGRYKS